MLKKLTEAFSLLPETESIALSGSRRSAINDESSDWDVYIYSSSRIMPETREKIFASIFPRFSVNCSPFEEGDECMDEDGRVYDIMYRSTEWTEWQIDDVYRKHNARVGYTTCFLYNIATSEVLFDRSGWLSSIIKELQGEYPEELRSNIIRKNMDVIDGNGASTFLIQAELAVKRGDIVSSNHRLAAILASYFDIIFAYNRVYHPGEKKLIGYAHYCKDLPINMDEDIEKAITTLGKPDHLDALRTLVSHLHDFTAGA